MTWMMLAGMALVLVVYGMSVDKAINATRARSEDLGEALSRRCAELEAEANELRREVDYLKRRIDA